MMKKALCGALLAFSLGLLSGEPKTDRTAPSGDEIAKRIHDLVNIERAKADLSPLSWNEKLGEAARLHSEDMAKNEYLDHMDKQGNDPSGRAKALGVECGKNYGNEIKVGITENIYYAESYAPAEPKGDKTTYRMLGADEIAKTAIEGLMKNSSHREAILDGEYTSEGIGAAADKFGRVYITQDFCLGRYSLPEPEKKPEIILSELAKKVHELVNKERAKRRMQALSWNDKLAEAARLHSEDMAKYRYFAHKNREGKDPSKRAYDIGFRCEKKVGSYIKVGVGENISQNNTYTTVTYIGETKYYDYQNMDEIASTTVDGWMKSEGHRENILTLDYSSEGIGVAISENGEVFITEDFC